MLKKILFLCVFVLILAGCGTPTTPCGEFTFNGAPHTNQGIDVTLDFDFDPDACGAPDCTCDTVAYVQIVRIIDFDTGGFLSPNSDQTNRIVNGRAEATLNGWAIDRLMGRVWGYYGRNNDRTFASTLTPGSDISAATLRDSPSNWPNGSWFDAVSVPVCIDPEADCENQLAGYYYWSFFVNNSGSVGDPYDANGVEWHRDAFDEAVLEWNNDAPGLAKNSFPAFIRMP
ncbi:MAG: hypothetical protein ACK2UF_19345 [Candidatus Promineifilaceae bacterium]